MIKGDEVVVPFTDEEVKKLNETQELAGLFTCCGHEGCKRDEINDHGLLKATNGGWICPCGKYTQDWAHKNMLDIEQIKRFLNHGY